jgi:hypothetical protein
MTWHAFGDGRSTGTKGSEGGTIVLDEEHPGGARITLEQGGHTAPWAITCGVYGLMVHTRFFADRSTAEAEYEAMKRPLAIRSPVSDTLGNQSPRTSRVVSPGQTVRVKSTGVPRRSW